MTRPVITYHDVLIKQRVQDWGDAIGIDAEDTILLHFEERFGVKSVHVELAHDEGDHLLLEVVTDQWSTARQFALSQQGSLIW